MRMALAWRFGVLVTLLAIVSTSALDSLIKGDFMRCESLVKNWAVSSFDNEVEEDKQILKDLLFFLHIPRTGGRTYFHCFLRKLYTSDQECPRSYDKLRVDPSKPNCRLLVTHDDYSMMSKLPKEKTSVVTILRNPIDRVFSTYEFSVEVAARFLVHPNLSSATQMSGRIRPKSRAISTLDIWPWKYLVPWMREDLFVRRDARKLGEFVGVHESSDSYNMEEIAMPLHVFINHPIAHDIIHNGATFQVAGLTNNSFLAESHEVRQCVRKHPALGQYVLEVAKRRLDNMLYVGLTEDHKKSATMFANMVGAQVLSQSESLNSRAVQESSNRTELSSSMVESEPDGSNELQSSNNGQEASEVPSPNAAEGVKENMTVGKLMDAYEVCICSLRKSQTGRRTMSLKRIAPANFSKESRLLVPEMVLQQILSLNSLDVALYKHAQDIFAQQQRHLVHKLGTEKSKLSDSYRYSSPWKLFLLSVTALLFIALMYMIVTARRTSKLKV